DASFRTDDNLQDGLLSYYSSGFNASAKLGYVGTGFNRLNIIGSMRRINFNGLNNDEDIMLGRFEYNANFLKRVIGTSTYYQIGTGREQRRTYSFTLVQAGMGTHSWVDYNDNGIEELNEFEPAVFADQARYIKVYLPGNDFIKSNSNEFNQSLRLQAPQQWQGANILKRTIYKFNTITSYRADRKVTDNSFEQILNPFLLNIADSSLLSVNSLIKQTTFFNRSGAKFGMEHTIQTQRGKQFLYSGFESRRTDKNQLTSRLRLFKQFNLVFEAEQSLKESGNNFFENRNYKYKTTHLFPELFFQTRKGLRVGTYYKYTEAFNAPELGNESAFLFETGVEFRYFILNKGNIDANFASHMINYNGNPNSPIAYDLLNGLSNGRNYTWKIL